MESESLQFHFNSFFFFGFPLSGMVRKFKNGSFRVQFVFSVCVAMVGDISKSYVDREFSALHFLERSYFWYNLLIHPDGYLKISI